METSYDGAHVVVTGGSGFIGANLVEALHRAGAQVWNLDVAAPRNAAAAGTHRPVDILDARSLTSTLDDIQPRLVFHLAARTDLEDSPGGYACNDKGVGNLTAAVDAAESVERIVFTSSQLVCRLGYHPRHDTDYAPSSEYGRSKVRGEEIVRNWIDARPAWIIVRPTSVWGPWFGQPYRPFFDAVLQGRFVVPRSLSGERSFGYVGNVVHQYLALAASAEDSVDRRTFYLSDYAPVSVRDFAQMIASIAGKGRIREAPDWLLAAIARIGDGLGRLGWTHPPLTTSRLANMTTSSVADIGPTRAVVGDLPYTLEDGITETLEWMRRPHS